MKLLNEEVTSAKTFNKTRSAHEILLISEKRCFVLQYTNIDSIEIFHALHDKLALLPWKCFECGARNRQHRAKHFLKGLDQVYTKI